MSNLLEVKEKIEDLRSLLHNALTNDTEISTNEIMKISKEFDAVLNKYYELLKEEDRYSYK